MSRRIDPLATCTQPHQTRPLNPLGSRRELPTRPTRSANTNAHTLTPPTDTQEWMPRRPQSLTPSTVSAPSALSVVCASFTPSQPFVPWAFPSRIAPFPLPETRRARQPGDTLPTQPQQTSYPWCWFPQTLGRPPHQRVDAEHVRDALPPAQRSGRRARTTPSEATLATLLSTSPCAPPTRPMGAAKKEALMPTPLALTHTSTCAVPGCGNRAIKHCANCGEARCPDHILPTIDDTSGTVIHFCPACMEAYTNELEHEVPPEHRILGILDRVQRAGTPHEDDTDLRSSPALPASARVSMGHGDGHDDLLPGLWSPFKSPFSQ